MSEQTKEQSVWHDKDDTLESKVYQAIGAGSMCWSETPKGVFDSDNAKKYGDELWKAIEADRAALLRERDEALALVRQFEDVKRHIEVIERYEEWSGGSPTYGTPQKIKAIKDIAGAARHFLSTQGSNTETK